MSDYTMQNPTPGSTPLPYTATAQMAGNPQNPNIKGKVILTQTSQGVIVEARIFGLPLTTTGFFAFHLHTGACGSPGGSPDFFPETGGHYNPQSTSHPHHAGDFPPLMELNDGAAYLCFLTDRFTLREAIGRSVVIHANPDDFTTQPAGNAGTKLACGTIMETPRLY